MTAKDFTVAEHDRRSETFADEWINRDIQRDGERRPRPKHMLSFTQLANDASIAVLDVGGGFGVVSEEVLQTLSRSRVTLQDYSQPMLDREQAPEAIVAARTKR